MELLSVRDFYTLSPPALPPTHPFSQLFRFEGNRMLEQALNPSQLLST